MNARSPLGDKPQRARRTTLFVGALALEALAPALVAGADIVCIDLEDAVPPERKDEARARFLEAVRALAVPADVQLIARVNEVRSPEGREDLRAILGATTPLGALMLPKVDDAADIRAAAAQLEQAGSALELYAIIETAAGLENAAAIAHADPRLAALFFGGFDLSTALGCAMAWEPLLYARSRTVHAAALAGIECLDSPFPGIEDLEGLRASCAQACALGMTGKAAKHASQIATIRAAFTPTREEISRARDIVTQFRADPTRPLVYEGKLIELPAVKRLERIARL